MLRTRTRRVLAALAALILAPVVALVVASFLTPLPPELAAGRPPGTGTVIRDRHGVVIRELLADDGTRARWASLDEVGERVLRAVLAAEDVRFARHPGVDPLAVVRALGQLVVHRRVVSGASTITQQLARNLVRRPRTLRGKFMEAALALRIERSLGKRAILEQYLNRVSFGPGVRGIEAASHAYFDKPARDLSLAEAAALASIPRGPSLYDPRKGTARLQRRRDRVLARMLGAGLAGREEVDRALAEPIAVSTFAGSPDAPHLVRAVMGGAVEGTPMRERTSDLTLTVDRQLQREITVLALDAVHGMAKRRVTAAAVVVIENASGEILGYVGSPDIDDAARLGQNDGVLALRQPGSTLKPFVYELAMERLGFTAATVLPDVELFLPTKDGDYRPNNYDGRYHGPVRLREALANSYNVPAVWTANALGASRVLDRLTALGFSSLDRDAEHYGAALALGDGEVRLLDLANAYATLARGGVWKPVRAVKAAVGKDGRPLKLQAAAERLVLDEAETAVITDVLADKDARLSSFGEGNVLELPFPAAAKTGTSKGFRDNYAVGYTRRVTVGVWVGNFDGAPMEGVSGISGAGPLFHDAMLAAARAYPADPLGPPAGIVEAATVCSLSGMRPSEDCPHQRREVFALREGRSTAPAAPCSMHARVRIDKRNGLRAGGGCPAERVEDRVFERFDATFTAWARSAGRSVAPEAWSPLCPGPGPAIPGGDGRLRIAYPPDGARFSIDPGASAHQAIGIRADVPPGVTEVRIVVDGHARALRAPFAFSLPLTAGEHRVRVEADGAGADEVGFSVE
jgi:penicillin-binding protein 1C